MNLIPFNVNDHVQVKLTDLGRRIHKENYAKILGGKLAEMYPYKPPEEDAEGWSRWKLWDLMKEFGPVCGNGSPLPFETEIRIETIIWPHTKN